MVRRVRWWDAGNGTPTHEFRGGVVYGSKGLRSGFGMNIKKTAGMRWKLRHINWPSFSCVRSTVNVRKCNNIILLNKGYHYLIYFKGYIIVLFLTKSYISYCENP